MNRANRFRLIREACGLNQAEMADRVAVKRNTWGRYESGDLPTGETLDKLADMGFSVDWLLTGKGEMRPRTSSPDDPRPAIDPDLLGRVIDGVVSVYKDQGQRLAPVNQGQIVGSIYDRLAAIGDDAERRGALRYALDQLRDELRRAASQPTSSKRPA